MALRRIVACLSTYIKKTIDVAELQFEQVNFVNAMFDSLRMC